MNKPTLDVIIITYEANQQLELCLEGFCNQDDPDFKVYVVNDGGTFTTDKVVGNYANRLKIEYLYLDPPSKEFRLSRARNLGLSRCTADRILTIDGDCIPSRFVTAKHKMAGRAPIVLSGMRRHLPESCWEKLTKEAVKDVESLKWNPEYRHEHGHEFQIQAFQETRYHGACWGMHVSFPRLLLQKVGGWNERFVGYGAEDEELCVRMVRKGAIIVYRPDLFVYHLDHPLRSGDPASRKLYRETVHNG